MGCRLHTQGGLTSTPIELGKITHLIKKLNSNINNTRKNYEKSSTVDFSIAIAHNSTYQSA